MRYLLLIFAMLGDILLVGTTVVVCLWYLNFVSFVIVVIAWKVWWGQGGPFVWRRKSIQRFLKNAKELGL